MKTSWIKTKKTEEFLHKRLSPDEHLLYTAELLIDCEKQSNTAAQEQTYELVKLYSRRKLRAEIELVHQTLFSDNKHSTFKKMIFSIFSSR